MQVCSLCKKADNNPPDYGEFMKRSDICVHYYCLLLSTNLPQKGLDYSGILGFLLKDIRKEIKSAAERICCYCLQAHASIECHKCKLYFHNICGNKNGCVSEFINEFNSYCHKHVPFGKEKMLAQQNISSCWICHEALGEFSPTQTLRSYCCKNGYVHRHCLRKYALAAGYHLVCIWCTSKDFRDDVRKHGVFVPDREASWDNNETLRYTDLHRGYSQCDAKVCLCPQGREFFRGPWKLIVCCMCGGSGVHSKCARDQIRKNNYTCETCRQILTSSKQSKGKRKAAANTACNYTMFISKTLEDTEQVLEAVNSSGSDSYEQELVEEVEKEDSDKKGEEAEDEEEEEETPKLNTSQNSKSSNTQSNPVFSAGQSSEKQSKISELFMFGKAGHIVGTVQVEKSKIQQNPDRTVKCKEKDVLGFSSSDNLLNSIFSDIVAEGRELSEDMVNEVFDRYKLLLENFGDYED